MSVMIGTHASVWSVRTGWRQDVESFWRALQIL